VAEVAEPLVDSNEAADADEGLPVEPGIGLWRPSAWSTLSKQMRTSIARLDRFWGRRGRSSLATSVYETTTALVIDPGLHMEGGHNYPALLRLKAELSKLNVEHACLGSMLADKAVRKLAAPVLPARGLWWRSHYTRAEFLKHAKVMSDQLSLALNDQKRPPDLLVLDCCDAVQICAVAEYYGRSVRIPTPHLLIWLLLAPNHFKQMGDPSMAAQIDECREAFAALRTAIGDDRKINVVCETAALATAYKNIIGFDVGIAPCPNLAGADGKELRRKREPTSRIVALGHANEAKGYLLLPEAINHVLGLDNRATFFIHGILQGSDTTDGSSMFDALSRMGPRVIASNDILTPSEYLSHLLEADILLLPYDREIYETRGSGLFNEAREIGIPVVATGGCAFAQPAFDEGWGIEIAERSSAGLAKAILTALDRLPDLVARAEEVAGRYRPDDVGAVLRKVVGDIRLDERSVRAAAVKHRRRAKRRPLPKAFSSVRLQEGASIRDEASLDVTSSVPMQQTGRLSAITLMMGKLVDTTSMPYRYSVVLNIDPREVWSLPASSHVSAEMSIEVTAGKVGVAWADENHEVLDGAERYAPAMPGLQRLVVPVPAKRAYQLVLRNFASGSVPTSFRILGLRAIGQHSVGVARVNKRTLRTTPILGKRRKTTRNLPDTFFTRIYLQEGAAVRGEPQDDTRASARRQRIGRQSATALIVGKIIDTSSVPHRYSIVLDTKVGETSHLPADGCVTVEISVEVIAGMVGAVWTDENSQVLEDTERFASALPGVQRLVVAISSDRRRQLVLRNCAPASVPTSFRLLAIRAQIHHLSRA
jgi:glycosyltransferase involved in cell wall biosynthesis